ncbi:ABC transporter substrate-binding protein [Arthrobacter sp. FW306-2-2C-D06B]|uniref:ABC transporter substrate-binding protein n=1 Tax=Arthrobacter sp. FW306-2-2C-D06B TaxID=2879618 RepID=UPI001F4687BC|nr:ABC transporter substrate-binding protein [Arthrobacter sp. FW306-2-2C-D06B]UKA57786.1 ABC transporter substrate-binding protein [Arthrobacter sp. FW306-2-2C-D06B]
MRTLPSLRTLTKRTTAFLAAAGLLALAGCASPAASSSPSSRPFTVNWATTLTNIDPAFVCAGNENSFASNFYARLVKLDEDQRPDGTLVANTDPGRVKGDLATSWTVSPDGKAYTFSLHPGAKFANGNPLDAEAVRYSIMRNLTIGGCGSLGLQIGLTDPPLISGVVVVDPGTVRLELSRAYPAILVTLAQSRGSIYDPKVIKEHGEDKKGVPNQWLAAHTASSSGPYILDEYVANNYAVLKRNPNYYGQAAKEPVVRVNFITSIPTLMLQARRGEADVTLGLPPYVVHELSQNDCCTVTAAPAFAPVTVSFDNSSGVTSNPKLREALTYAVPYEQIKASVAYGYADSYYGPFVPGTPGFDTQHSAPRPLDKDRARALVKESGLENPQIDLMINPTSPGVSTLATILKASWEDIGVTVNIDSQTPTAFATKFNTGKYQSALLFESAGAVAAYELRKKMTCGSSFNNQHICIPGTPDLMKQLDNAPDLQAQQPYINALVDAWRASSPTIILYRAQFTAVLAHSVKAFDYASSTTFYNWGR